MKHLLITPGNHQGWEYGMLRCLEEEIIRQTGAQRLVIPHSAWRQQLNRRLGQGTRYGPWRQFMPRQTLRLPKEVDVVWLVLMGPENYNLDFFKDWPVQAKHRIVYLFDTLPSQMKVIERLFSGAEWNVRVTSFDDAVPLLEQRTGQPWQHADQAVSLSYFPIISPAERVIHFSAYGRRQPQVHEAVRQFCADRGLYYDYTTHGRGQPTAEPLELFRQFAWHLGHSRFTFCWPVETTNPGRAGDLSPITCRWFEAAAAGAVVLGQPPKNPHFRELFGDDFVTPIGPDASTEVIGRRLEEVWERREALSARAAALRQKLGTQLDWSARVKRMLEAIK